MGRLGANLFCPSEPSLHEEGTLSIPAGAFCCRCPRIVGRRPQRTRRNEELSKPGQIAIPFLSVSRPAPHGRLACLICPCGTPEIKTKTGIRVAAGAFSGCTELRRQHGAPMNDNTPDKPVWLMRDKATMAIIQGLRLQGITTAADIARALNDQAVLPPKGNRWHAALVQRIITQGTASSPSMRRPS